MNETIQEYVDSRGVTMRVDRQQGVIRGVKVLGLQSRNGRTYLAEALREAVGLYEGAKVNVNHPKANPLAARDYQDRIGNLRNVSLRPAEGLFADFHFNPKHVLAEQLLWDAEHAPENVGFSHNVLARTARRGEQTVVEAITCVQSVDLVADPATTQGLFESLAPFPVRQLRVGLLPDGCDSGLDERLARSGVTRERETALAPGGEPDTAATLAGAAGESLDPLRPEPIDALFSEQTSQLEQMRQQLAHAEAELQRLRASEAQTRREVLIHRLLGEAGLSRPGNSRACRGALVTERFMETLLAAPDEQTVRELIRDRVELIEDIARGGEAHGRPRCRDQSTVAGRRSTDTAAFVRAIT